MVGGLLVNGSHQGQVMSSAIPMDWWSCLWGTAVVRLTTNQMFFNVTDESDRFREETKEVEERDES